MTSACQPRWPLEYLNLHQRYEGNSQFRTGAVPRALADFRNLAINAFRLDGRANIAHARLDLLNHDDAVAVCSIRQNIIKPDATEQRQGRGSFMLGFGTVRVFSGIKPTGEATLGTILGAIKPWTEVQGPDAFFCIVDLHALTMPQDPVQLRELTYDIAATFIAVGIDPGQTNMFIQSQVAEHNQLAWLLECTASFGELQRMTQFKDKAKKNVSVTAGLFTYPVLMAADILLYQTEVVPVGEDQVQHVELTRDLAQRFNARFGDIFTLPKATIKKAGARIRDLQHPENKMSKSEDSNGTILVTDDLAQVRRRIMRAVTDAEAEVRFDFENKPGVSNLLTIYAAIEDLDPAALADDFSSYKDLKQTVADRVCDFLEPIQTRRAELLADRAELGTLLKQGCVKAQQIAEPTLRSAEEAVGLIL